MRELTVAPAPFKILQMHIPDGFLSPETCAASYAVAIPFVYYSFKKVLDEEHLARLGVLSALAFVVMMINIPIPGGTSGHALGTSLLAILFGPWKAVASLSVVLALQAIIFGDGGITTYGANLIVMGIIPAFVGYWAWQITRKWGKFSYFLSGYVSLVFSSLTASLILGLQALIFRHGALPLYFPYGLKVTVPAMLVPTLLFFAPLEGILNLAVLSYIKKDEKGS